VSLARDVDEALAKQALLVHLLAERGDEAHARSMPPVDKPALSSACEGLAVSIVTAGAFVASQADRRGMK